VRILLLSGEYPPQPGGIGDYTRRLGGALAAAGAELQVLTAQRGMLQLLRLYSDGSEQSIASVWRSRCTWRLRDLSGLRRVIRQVRPDWLHIQYQTGAFDLQVGVNLLPWLMRGSGVRTAITYHDLLPPYLFPKAGRLRDQVTYLPARTADLVIATNPADQQQLQRAGISSRLIPIGSNIAVQPPANFQRAAWRAQLGAAPATELIATFGLLSHSKGTDLLLDLLIDQPHRRLLLVGGAAISAADQAFAVHFQQQVQQRGLAPQVIMTGHVDEVLVSAYLLAADVVVLPFRDGASLRRGSLLAALAHGCAVVTTQPQDEETEQLLGGAALLCAAQAADLQTAVSRLLGDGALRAQLATAAVQVAAQFGWPAIAEQHRTAYTAVTDGTA
jgi:glycosyltransferase involved in cell wall biosynthesis